MTYAISESQRTINNEKSFCTGLWKQDLQHGQCTMVYPNGSRYEGEWVNGLKFGQGKLKIISTNKAGRHEEQTYVGEFKDDLFDGKAFKD